MPPVSVSTNQKTDAKNVVSVVNYHLLQNEPTDIITWLLLGGKNFMASKPVTAFDFLAAGTKGIPKLSLLNLAAILHAPMKDIAQLLNVSYKTLGRKKDTDILDNVTSSHSIEIANTLAKGLYVFEDAEKLNRWLQKPNRALNNQKPFDLLNTQTGIKLVNQVIGRIDEGVYT